MICLEKLQQDRPDLIELAKDIFGDSKEYFGCPHMFGYARRPSLVGNIPNWCCISCTDCWNRKVENTEGER